jgi:transposase-like protein
MRRQILAAAEKGQMTAAQVLRRFGVTPVTFYSWRRKGKTGPRSAGSSRRGQLGVLESGVNLVEAIRLELRSQIQRVLPELVRSEVGAALLGPPRRSRRKR